MVDEADTKSDTAPSVSSSTPWLLLAGVGAVLVILSPFIYLLRSNHMIAAENELPIRFIGSKGCARCHQAVYEKWRNSHHDLAMAVASEEIVKGDFNDAVYFDKYNNVTSRFFREDDKYFVETEGSDGDLERFQITHTFGVYPLQQYLIPFEGGRLQCLNIAWDDREKSWYRLPPYEVKGPSDWLHWTNGAQTWNGMCAECHSTTLKKNYDKQSNIYTTGWAEINVGCEACHGPGSNHRDWAEKPAMGRPSLDNDGLTVTTRNLPAKSQIALCAPCHSRRFQLGDNDHSEGELLDKLVPSLLDEGLYYPDGQILEEVYVYGSFVQSKMYQKDVRCSDCHDPHSLKPHAENNTLCLQCHRKQDYDTEAHHFHKKSFQGKPSEGYLCVKCHMPGRYYMGIDYRQIIVSGFLVLISVRAWKLPTVVQRRIATGTNLSPGSWRIIQNGTEPNVNPTMERCLLKPARELWEIMLNSRAWQLILFYLPLSGQQLFLSYATIPALIHSRRLLSACRTVMPFCAIQHFEIYPSYPMTNL